MIVYTMYLLAFTLRPFTFSVDWSTPLFSLYAAKFEGLSGLPSATALDIGTNVLLFAPLGFLLVALAPIRKHARLARVALATLFAFGLSLTIESCQLFLPRGPSMVDVLFNTSGGICGAVVSDSYYPAFRRVGLRWLLHARTTRVLAPVVGAYVLGLMAAFNIPYVRTDFGNWDSGFSLQLGNEATMDRPWLGKIYLVAVYDRALDRAEIRSNLAAGAFAQEPTRRVREGLVALYTFSEPLGAVVPDRSFFGPPLDLYVGDPERVKWLSPNGIEIVAPTIVTHEEPAAKLFNSRIWRESSLTVEAWIAPANVEQSGPARIVSYSHDPYRRNFTLAQDGRNIVFRLRTPLTGLNGMRPELRTRDDPLTTGLQHVAITYLEDLEVLA